MIKALLEFYITRFQFNVSTFKNHSESEKIRLFWY